MSEKNKTEIMWMAWNPKYKFAPQYWGKTKKEVLLEMKSRKSPEALQNWQVVKVKIEVITNEPT